jgi:hypothetical protein
MPFTTFTTRLLLLSLLTGVTTVAFAQHAANGKPDKDSAPKSAIDHSGQVAAVDAKGKLRQPTPEELEALSNDLGAKLNQSIDESKVLRKADGTLAVFTGDMDMNFMLMKTNPDGTTTTDCVDNIRQAREFLGLDKKTETKKNEAKRDANGLEVE